MSQAVVFKGVAELDRFFRRADAQLHDDLRHVLSDVGEPVRSGAEQLATERIRNIGSTWFRMRTGVVVGSWGSLVYVAPKSRRRVGLARPRFAPILLDTAMRPALDDQRGEVIRRLEQMLDRVLGT